MKTFLHLIFLAVLVVLTISSEPDGPFTRRDVDKIIVAPDGTEYVYVTSCVPYVFGERTFLGTIKGERQSRSHQMIGLKDGMYSFDSDPELRVLERVVPWDQFPYYYSKATLPPIALTNCSRFEFIAYENTEMGSSGKFFPDYWHLTCGEGIAGKENTAEFLADVKSQKMVREAWEKTPYGTTGDYAFPDENYGYIYGYFDDYPKVAVCLDVRIYNGKSYSVSIYEEDVEKKIPVRACEYVLPEKWLSLLTDEQK